MSLTFEYCVKRLIRQPPSLSRKEAQKIRLLGRRHIANEIFHIRDLIPPATIVVPCASLAQRVDFEKRVAEQIKEFAAERVVGVSPQESMCNEQNTSQWGKREKKTSVSKHFPLFSWANKNIEESVRHLASTGLFGAEHPSIEEEAMLTDAGNTSARRFQKRNTSMLRNGRSEMRRNDMDRNSKVSIASLVLDRTDASESFVLHRLTEIISRCTDLTRLFPQNPEKCAEMERLMILISALEVVTASNAVLPLSPRYSSSLVLWNFVDVWMLPTKWMWFAAAARAALTNPPSGKALPVDFAETHISGLRRFVRELETLVLATTSPNETIDETTPVGDTNEEEMFSHERFLANERQGFCSETILRVAGCELGRGSELPSILYTTRNLRELDLLALRDIAAYAESVLDCVRVTGSKITRYSLSSTPALARVCKSIRFEHLKVIQAVQGIFKLVVIEVARRFHESTVPVSVHEIGIFVRYKMLRETSSLMYPRRSSWIATSYFTAFPKSFMRTLIRRGLHQDCFGESNFGYLFWFLDRMLKDDVKVKFYLWRTHVEPHLMGAICSRWSFFLSPFQRQLSTSILGKAFKSSIAEAIAVGWVPLAHLLINTSWLDSSRSKNTLWTFARRSILLASEVRGRWPVALACMAAFPDSSSRSRFVLPLLRDADSISRENFCLFSHAQELFDCLPRESLCNLRYSTDLGNALWMLICLNDHWLDPVVINMMYETHSRRDGGNEWLQHRGIHALALAALIRCGPLTEAHSKEVDRVLKEIADSSQKDRKVSILRQHVNIPNTFSDSYGYLILMVVSHHTPSWLAAHLPVLCGCTSGSNTTMPLFPTDILRSLGVASAGDENFIMLALGLFFASVDKWYWQREALIKWWRKLLLSPAKKSARELNNLSELGGGLAQYVVLYRFFPTVFLLPADADVWFQRLHRTLCLHDDSSVYFRSNWDNLARMFVAAKGKYRAAISLQQAVSMLRVTSSSNNTNTLLTTLRLNTDPQRMRFTLISEIAQAIEPANLRRGIEGWWCASRVSCTENQTLFQPCELIGCNAQRLNVLVNIADRLMRDAENCREFMTLQSKPLGWSRPVPLEYKIVDEATHIRECIIGKLDPSSTNHHHDNKKGFAKFGSSPSRSYTSHPDSTWDEEEDSSAGFENFGLTDDPSAKANVTANYFWKCFLNVLFTDLARTLLDPGSMFCVRRSEYTPLTHSSDTQITGIKSNLRLRSSYDLKRDHVLCVGEAPDNLLFDLPWPHVPTGAYAHERRPYWSHEQQHYFQSRFPCVHPNPESAEGNAELAIAAWSCCFEIACQIGAPPPWFSAKEVWELVAMRMAPPSFIDALLLPCPSQQLNSSCSPASSVARAPAVEILKAYTDYFSTGGSRRSASNNETLGGVGTKQVHVASDSESIQLDESPKAVASFVTRSPPAWITKGYENAKSKRENEHVFSDKSAVYSSVDGAVKDLALHRKHLLLGLRDVGGSAAENGCITLVGTMARRMGIGASEQIELLAAVARAMASPSCTHIPRAAKSLFGAHVFELVNALRYSAESFIETVQLEQYSQRAHSTCGAKEDEKSGGGFSYRPSSADSFFAGHNASNLADILVVAFALDLHLSSPSYLWLTQRLGLTIKSVERVVVDEIKWKISHQAKSQRRRKNQKNEDSTSTEEVKVSSVAKEDTPQSTSSLPPTRSQSHKEEAQQDVTVHGDNASNYYSTTSHTDFGDSLDETFE